MRIAGVAYALTATVAGHAAALKMKPAPTNASTRTAPVTPAWSTSTTSVLQVQPWWLDGEGDVVPANMVGHAGEVLSRREQSVDEKIGVFQALPDGDVIVDGGSWPTIDATKLMVGTYGYALSLSLDNYVMGLRILLNKWGITDYAFRDHLAWMVAREIKFKVDRGEAYDGLEAIISVSEQLSAWHKKEAWFQFLRLRSDRPDEISRVLWPKLNQKLSDAYGKVWMSCRALKEDISAFNMVYKLPLDKSILVQLMRLSDFTFLHLRREGGKGTRGDHIFASARTEKRMHTDMSLAFMNFSNESEMVRKDMKKVLMYQIDSSAYFDGHSVAEGPNAVSVSV